MKEKNFLPEFDEKNDNNELLSDISDEALFGDGDTSLESMSMRLDIQDALRNKEAEIKKCEDACRELCRTIFNAFAVEIGKEAAKIEQDAIEKQAKKIKVDDKVKELFRQLSQLNDAVDRMNILSVFFGVKRAKIQERNKASAHWMGALRIQTDLANEISQLKSTAAILRKNQTEWSHVADQLESPVHMELIRARWNVLEIALKCQSAYKSFEQMHAETLSQVREFFDINPEDASPRSNTTQNTSVKRVPYSPDDEPLAS